MRTNSPINGGQCDRVGLRKLADDYLEALVKRDPIGLPLADGVKYTENTATIPIGDGLWVGASGGPTNFKIFAVDILAEQVGFFGVMEEFSEPVILALRIKVVTGKITEIEHVVARGISETVKPNLTTPRSGFLQPVPPLERVSRQDMLRIANAYFESIEQCNGDLAPFADNAERHENGSQTTTNKPPDPAAFGSSESERQKLAMARINALGVRDQMNCRILSYITRIQPRRLLIVDEEMGLVYGFPMFVHRGNVRTIHIIGVSGVDTVPMPYGPFNLQAGEIFKICGGQIHEIEANGCLLPYGSGNGWE
jgi:hypothetical protein